MEGQLGISGRLATKVIRAKRPGLGWFLVNWLRWGKIKSLIGVFLIQPVARYFGLMTA